MGRIDFLPEIICIVMLWDRLHIQLTISRPFRGPLALSDTGCPQNPG